MIVVVSSCEKMHITETELINPVDTGDGMLEGYTGSASEFCPVCDSSQMTAMDLVERTSVE